MQYFCTVVIQYCIGGVLPECDLILFPLKSLDSIALLPQVGLQLCTELIWDTTARPFHRPGNHIAMVRSCTVEGD